MRRIECEASRDHSQSSLIDVGQLIAPLQEETHGILGRVLEVLDVVPVPSTTLLAERGIEEEDSEKRDTNTKDVSFSRASKA